MENKRGQGLSVNAIILIVLGVVVLVILILGFTVGWDKIAPWIKTNNNVDTIVQACATACATQSTYDYCTTNRTLEADDLKEGETSKKSVTGSCHAFSDDANKANLEKYGIKKCPSITCPVPVSKDVTFN